MKVLLRIISAAALTVFCAAPGLCAAESGSFDHVNLLTTSAASTDATGASYHFNARLLVPALTVPMQAQRNTDGIEPGAENAGNPKITALAGKLGIRPAKVETSVGYAPPTLGHEFRRFARDAFGPSAVVRAAFIGAVDQADNVPPDWGQGWEAFGERVGSTFGRSAVTTAVLYGGAVITREDVEFYRCNCTGFAPRLKHAIWTTASARHGAEGHRIFSPVPIIAPYAGAFTSLAWYPDRYGPKDALRWGSWDLLYDLGENIGREFLNLNF